jgi:predicted permease
MGSAKINIIATLKKIFSPPLMGFVVGIIFVVLHIKLPSFIMSDLNYVGGLTIPMSMLFIGSRFQMREFRAYELIVMRWEFCSGGSSVHRC